MGLGRLLGAVLGSGLKGFARTAARVSRPRPWRSSAAMDSEEERSGLELTKLRKEIEKLEVDTRRAKHALPLEWYKAVLAGLGGTSTVIAVAKAFRWL